MELSFDDAKVKELLTEIIAEMMKQKREVFYNIVSDVLEDAGLGNAIAEGRKNEFVSEETIFNILEEKE
jgi:hypothetical protein